jgi:hypothetical protein
VSAIDLLDGIPLKGVGSEHLRDKLILPAHLSTGLFGVAGDLSIINAGDAAVAGSTGKVADAAHQHQYVTGAAASLALIAANSEGGSAASARADHGHSTNALPWGVVGTPQILTTGSATFTADDTTADFQLTGIVVSSTRRYVVCLQSDYQILSVPGRWLINFHVDGTLTDRIWEIDHATGGSNNGWVNGRKLWLPSSGTFTLDVGIDEVSGASSLAFAAAATATRQFWVEDVGPRP